ncbi:MAG TPA: ATP-binding protein [Gammaproteobacteria bacterium]|nr:ATP-binding protein [Gammaproteobacteria bacterium]
MRTPLAILTAGLDVVKGNGKIQALRIDAARMNGLVDRLLCLARLDSVALDTSQTLDLKEVAEREISALAPFALRKRCEIALERAGTPIRIKGNADAIADALRNIIENAVAHSPAGAEVMVNVVSPGIIRVVDQGPGIPLALREQVFERFWRGREQHIAQGLDLGLPLPAILCARTAVQ